MESRRRKSRRGNKHLSTKRFTVLEAKHIPVSATTTGLCDTTIHSNICKSINATTWIWERTKVEHHEEELQLIYAIDKIAVAIQSTKAIQKLTYQMSKMSSQMSERERGTFSSEPEINPRDNRGNNNTSNSAQLNAVHVLQSGKEVDNQVEVHSPTKLSLIHI